MVQYLNIEMLIYVIVTYIDTDIYFEVSIMENSSSQMWLKYTKLYNICKIMLH